jgi:septal ring factor EnvC (AmiA/AmiB activator)
MPIRKKRPSASDVLRQEMQQPLVIPARNPIIEPNPTPTTITNMTSPTNDDAATAAKLKQAQESEAKLQQQIEDLNSKLKAQATELKETKDTIVKLAEQGQAPAKSKGAALVKKDTSRSNASITARPTESREETARRRANTDIGWLD